MNWFRVSAVLLVASVTGAGLRAQPGQTSSTWPDSAGSSAWALPGRDYASTRFSPLAEITVSNIRGLRPVRTFETGVTGVHEGSPLVVGSTMYLHTPFPNRVVALNLASADGGVLWTYSVPKGVEGLTLPTGCCGAGTRGLAYHPAGVIIAPLLHGELAGLDAKSGRELWRLRNADWKLGGSMPGAPLVVKDLVVVGTGGAEYGYRGHVSAYDARTGRLVWRAFHTGPDADVLLTFDANSQYANHRGRDLGVSSWPTDLWKQGGATASGWISYDPALDVIYYGTDPPAPGNATMRLGDNKWSSTLFARNASTGAVRWALQLTPHDEWGYGAANESILVDLTFGGKPVKALVHFDRNGFAYTIDRTTGTLLIAERMGPLNWASQVDVRGAVPARNPSFAVKPTWVNGVCPSSFGIKGTGPAAYSPSASLFFVPLNNLCMNVKATSTTYTAGKPYSGVSTKITAGAGTEMGRLIAWNAALGSVAWQVQEPRFISSGTLATAGGLVFYGTSDGWLKAVDATQGLAIWQAKLPSGIVGSPISFSGPNGRQMIAVFSGIGGWLGDKAKDLAPEIEASAGAVGTLTIFALEQ